jgi:hypothetical protein
MKKSLVKQEYGTPQKKTAAKISKREGKRKRILAEIKAKIGSKFSCLRTHKKPKLSASNI